ncbi:unnamed protein product [Amoebophrya sp. A25]|nr:unnamed protein product [Amoebophrya sp. A25]|eukprot:GSA25T00008542001.1
MQKQAKENKLKTSFTFPGRGGSGSTSTFLKVPGGQHDHQLQTEHQGRNILGFAVPSTPPSKKRCTTPTTVLSKATTTENSPSRTTTTRTSCSRSRTAPLQVSSSSTPFSTSCSPHSCSSMEEEDEPSFQSSRNSKVSVSSSRNSIPATRAGWNDDDIRDVLNDLQAGSAQSPYVFLELKFNKKLSSDIIYSTRSRPTRAPRTTGEDTTTGKTNGAGGNKEATKREEASSTLRLTNWHSPQQIFWKTKSGNPIGALLQTLHMVTFLESLENFVSESKKRDEDHEEDHLLKRRRVDLEDDQSQSSCRSLQAIDTPLGALQDDSDINPPPPPLALVADWNANVGSPAFALLLNGGNLDDPGVTEHFGTGCMCPQMFLQELVVPATSSEPTTGESETSKNLNIPGVIDVESETKGKVKNLILKKNLPKHSYQEVHGSKPEITTFTQSFQGALDHILVGGAKIEDARRMPKMDEVCERTRHENEPDENIGGKRPAAHSYTTQRTSTSQCWTENLLSINDPNDHLKRSKQDCSTGGVFEDTGGGLPSLAYPSDHILQRTDILLPLG